MCPVAVLISEFIQCFLPQFLASRSSVLEHYFFLCACFLVLSVREEIEKQKSKERYMKLHYEGKTEQARADLARLAIIRNQREEAAIPSETKNEMRTIPV